VEFEEELEVELFFEEVGAALGIPQIFGNVATGFDLEGDATFLEGSAHIEDALAMRMVEPFGDAEEGSETACNALVVVIETGVGGMMAGRLRFSVVIANGGSNDGAVAAV